VDLKKTPVAIYGKNITVIGKKWQLLIPIGSNRWVFKIEESRIDTINYTNIVHAIDGERNFLIGCGPRVKTM